MMRLNKMVKMVATLVAKACCYHLEYTT